MHIYRAKKMTIYKNLIEKRLGREGEQIKE